MSGFNVRDVLSDLTASLTGALSQGVNNSENQGDNVTNAMLPGMSGTETPVMRVVNGLTTAFTALNNVMDPTGSFDEINGTSRGRNSRATALSALKPLTLEEVRNINKDDPLVCPICYDNLAEYTEVTDEETRANSSGSHSGTSSDATDTVISPFPGYDPSDPCIMFPAIETATYVNSYILGTEPELQRQETTSEPAADHYAAQIPECKHIFGYSCIVEWFQNNTTCPLCRRQVISEDTNSSGVNININTNTNTNNNNNRNTPMFFYEQAITESYVPIDWTCPPSTGMQMLDPPLTMPVPGVGSSSGPRTGRDPE